MADELPEAPRLLGATPTAGVASPPETLNRCRWCGALHPTMCWSIREIEFYEGGATKRVVLKDRPAIEENLVYSEDELDALLAEAMAEGGP